MSAAPIHAAIRAIVLIILCSVLLLSTNAAIVAAPNREPIRPALPISPALSARAAIAVDLLSGQVLFAVNADAPLHPASTIKMVTALLAWQILDRGEVVTIGEGDLVPEDFSKMGLMAGDVLTVEELLYGVLIPSGGDAALAVARVAGQRLDPETSDPVARFVQEMNAYADSIGMTGSSFGNPIGIDDEQTRSTAKDLALAAEAILDNWLLSNIVSTPWISIAVDGPNPRDLVIENTNELVLHEGAIGIKTGTTDGAGECLVNVYRYGGDRVVTVVLGSQDRYADTLTLVAAIEDQVRFLPLGGRADSAGAASELAAQGLWMPVGPTLTLSAREAAQLQYEVILDEAPVDRQRGVVEFRVGSAVVARLPVYSTDVFNGG